MSPIAWHVSLVLDPKTSTLDDPASCRLLSRTMLDCGEPFGLLAFRVHDHTLRALVQASESATQDFARHLRICLAHRMELATDFRKVRLSPVRGRQQLYWQLLHVLRGPALPSHDVLAEASNLHDLLALRVVGRTTRLRLRRLLPDLDPASLRSLLPVSDSATKPILEELLSEAAAAAACLPHIDVPGIDGRHARAALHLARVALRTRRGRGPSVTARALQELLAARNGQELVDAVLRQARLRSAITEARSARTVPVPRPVGGRGRDAGRSGPARSSAEGPTASRSFFRGPLEMPAS